MVQATATTNEGIEGVYSYINIETGFVDIGFGDGFIGEGGDIDFEKITFNKPVLGEGEKYGVNFSDDQFANFTGPIPIDENFKNKFFDENAEAAFDDLDINFTADVNVFEFDLSGTSESSLGSELIAEQFNLGGAYDDNIKWTMNDPNAILNIDDSCVMGDGVTFEFQQGNMEAPTFSMDKN